MSYLAIARKWRPTTFDEIVGQGHVTRTLRNAIKLGRIHHAFLFTGARGVGKTTAARTLARALNCEEGPTPDPCGECVSCRELLSGNSPDVIEIDGASNNSVDDIRDLRDSVRYLPQRGRSKVYIVDEVHMLSKGAFNALLKTLEEPPAHVVFIFATTEPQKIPDTILSRVQRFDFKRIPSVQVVTLLRTICEAEGVEIPEDGLRLVARAGEGSMRDSQSLLDQVISFAGDKIATEQVAEILGLVDRTLLYDMLDGMLQGDADRCLQAIDQVYGYGYDLSEFTSEMLELLRNATLVGLSPSSKRYLDVPDDERSRLEGLAESVSSDVFVRSFQVMLDVHEQVARAPRPRLVLEMAVARLVTIRPARPLDQIVQRLGDLERRLRHGGVHPRPRGGGGGGGGGGSTGGDAKDDDPRPAGPTRQARAPGPQASLRSEPAARSEARPAPGAEARPAPRAEARHEPVAPVHLVREAPSPSLQPPAPLEVVEAPLQAEETPPVVAPTVAEDDEEAVIPPVPGAMPGASPRERWLLLQRWFEHLGPRYQVLAFDTAVGAVRPPVLQIWSPSDFKKRVTDKLQQDPRLLEGLASLFPGCTAVEIRLRPDEVQAPTRREREAAERAAHVEALRVEMSDHPLVKRVQDVFGATLVRVLPADLSPLSSGDGHD